MGGPAWWPAENLIAPRRKPAASTQFWSMEESYPGSVTLSRIIFLDGPIFEKVLYSLSMG